MTLHQYGQRFAQYLSRLLPGCNGSGRGINPYRKTFFRGATLLTFILLGGGLWAAAMAAQPPQTNYYHTLALVLVVVWAVILLRYFLWATYFYNINCGYTDADWQAVFAAREKVAMGKQVPRGSTKAPRRNPYHDQTFGLPPGTVRGMIAFTLLFGAMALLVAALGEDLYLQPGTLLHDHFEFYKTAFLMMIAFYFGDKSLQYLMGSKPTVVPVPKPKADTPLKPVGSSLTNWWQPVAEAPLTQVLTETELEATAPARFITDADLQQALNYLKTQTQLDVSLPVLQAVTEVESAGSGFLKDGRAKILFEGHVFWRCLQYFMQHPEADEAEPRLQTHIKGRGIKAIRDAILALQAGNEDILYEKWSREHYRGGAGEYDRLERAKAIHYQSAVMAASWGKFQVLGENLLHHLKSRGYTSVADFEAHQQQSEYYHLLDFLAFCTDKQLQGQPLIYYLSEEYKNVMGKGQYGWDAFALGYNGKAYKQNNYDTKLKRAYAKYYKA